MKLPERTYQAAGKCGMNCAVPKHWVGREEGAAHSEVSGPQGYYAESRNLHKGNGIRFHSRKLHGRIAHRSKLAGDLGGEELGPQGCREPLGGAVANGCYLDALLSISVKAH